MFHGFVGWNKLILSTQNLSLATWADIAGASEV